MEGPPGENTAPPGWYGINTVDLQPGTYGVALMPVDGNTYLGMHSGPVYHEGVSQQLQGVLRAGHYYSMYLDLAFQSHYGYDACYGNLAIYGSNTPGDTTELLWESGAYTDTTWQRYTPFFSPSADYTYILLCPRYRDTCGISDHGVVVMVDNLSNRIFERLKLEFSTTITCPEKNTGSIILKAGGGTPPYTYQWEHDPAANVTHLQRLGAGTYTVTVTDSKGVSTKGQAVVKASSLHSAVKITTSRCYGNADNQITITTTGGLPPYRYYLGDNTSPAYTPVFGPLASGMYKVLVRDEQGCENLLDSLPALDPPRLAIRGLTVKPCSCGEVQDGKIIPLVEGGTPPYEYRINNGLWQRDSAFLQLPAGNYRYEIKDQHGCGLSGANEITSPWEHCLVIMPSAFSPNGDGNNDIFRPKIYDQVSNFKLSVYNRWGGLIFQTNDPEKGWDGIHNGQPSLAQAYVYVCTYNDRNNQPQALQGTVTLVR